MSVSDGFLDRAPSLDCKFRNYLALTSQGCSKLHRSDSHFFGLGTNGLLVLQTGVTRISFGDVSNVELGRVFVQYIGFVELVELVGGVFSSNIDKHLLATYKSQFRTVHVKIIQKISKLFVVILRASLRAKDLDNTQFESEINYLKKRCTVEIAGEKGLI
jgi:hypothetical protein